MSDHHKPSLDELDPVVVLDDILELLAEDDAETGTPSAADRQWSRRLEASVNARIAEMRQKLTPNNVLITRGVTIPPEILAMNRDALVAELEILRQGRNVRYAHRDLTGLSDHNLRILLAIAVGSNRR